jgi:hypothetical protein
MHDGKFQGPAAGTLPPYDVTGVRPPTGRSLTNLRTPLGGNGVREFPGISQRAFDTLHQEKVGWLTGFEPATARSTIWGSNQAELQPPPGTDASQEGVERQPETSCVAVGGGESMCREGVLVG